MKKYISFIIVLLIFITSFIFYFINANQTYTKNDTNNESVEDQNKDIIEKDPSRNLDLDNITKEKGKVNIYLFWGKGCPHCEKELKMFKNLKNEYQKYYNLYTFEVWNNKENANLLNIFTDAMGDKKGGIPYTVIGEKSFRGFQESTTESIKNAIIDEKDKNFDVYLNKIKK